MNKKKNRKICRLSVMAAVFIMICLSAVNAYAASSDFSSLHGEPKSGTVDIEVESYRDDDGKLERCPDIVRIKAGDNTSYIPVIVNRGSECNLRIRVYAGAGEQRINILKYCYGFEDSWIYEGGWFYYRKAFEINERARICDGFYFPDEWKWRQCNVLDITVEAEAVSDEDMPESAVRTGDDSLVFGCAAVAATALFVLIVMSVRRKYGDKNI